MEFSSIDETGHKHGAEKPAMKGGLSMVTGNTVKGSKDAICCSCNSSQSRLRLSYVCNLTVYWGIPFLLGL